MIHAGVSHWSHTHAEVLQRMSEDTFDIKFQVATVLVLRNGAVVFKCVHLEAREKV